MRIALVHNYYQWPGGEDRVFATEGELLEANGHEVSRYTVHNDRVHAMGRLALAHATIWNGGIARELRARWEREGTELVHFHNTFPLISPAAHHAARDAGLAVVQTLHNYRLLCPGATFFRDGRPCEDCLGRSVAWPAIAHRCYRDSRTASAGVTAMLAIHRALRTWRETVDVYVAPSEFVRAKFIEGGLPHDRVMVKPHFLPSDPGVGTHAGEYALFVGRISREKGIVALLDAWRRRGPPCQLRVAGTGPLEHLLVSPPAGVEWLGPQPPDAVSALMREALLLVAPSEVYETFGLTVIEAFATGLPVLVTRGGALAELVRDGVTGFHVEPNDPEAILGRVCWALAHPAELAAMGRCARHEFEANYTAAANYERLIRIYERAT
jgi:glycosyltransferase involved in cell wall biosynthesis